MSSIFVKASDFRVKCITSKKEIKMLHRLRHRIFSKELKWVPETDNSLEIDGYDKYAIALGVIGNKNEVIAALRIITSKDSFMLEKEFPMLIKEDVKIRKDRDTVEVSRLCVAPEARNISLTDNFGVHAVSMLLYKGLYHWCLYNRVQYLYLVVEQRVHRLLCARGFPCKLLGPPVVMSDGTEAVAAILDWREFEEINITKRGKMLEWFSRYQSSLQIKQLQQRVSCLPHQVFS